MQACATGIAAQARGRRVFGVRSREDCDVLFLLTVARQEIPAVPLTLEQQRLQQLYDPDTTKLYDAEDMKNYYAVIRDYENKTITHPPPGKVYFYYGGFKVTDQVTPTSAATCLREKVDCLVEEHGIGKVWAEGVRIHSTSIWTPADTEL